MSIFNFLTKNKNPYFIKTKVLFRKKFKNTDKIYFLHSFPLKDYRKELMTSLIGDINFLKNIKTMTFNKDLDNVEIYLVTEKKSLKKQVVVITDPAELFEAEEIVDVFYFENKIPKGAILIASL